MFETTLAALVLLTCIVLAVHMALPAARQRWMEAQGRKALASLRRGWHYLANWRRRRDFKRVAEAEAQAAIKRARSGSRMVEGEWDGNVYRPKSFDPKKRDKRDLH